MLAVGMKNGVEYATKQAFQYQRLKSGKPSGALAPELGVKPEKVQRCGIELLDASSVRGETGGLTANTPTQRENAAAYAFLAPALALMAAVGVVPLAFVAFYSVNDTFAGNDFVFVGSQWFRQVLASPEFHGALLRSFGFSALVLVIEIPLGLLIALKLAPKGWMTGTVITLLAIPLLMPAIVAGYLWKGLTLPGTGPLQVLAAALGFGFDMNNPVFVWAALLLMDAWRWTGMVVLLCFAGLRAIPDDYYRAARIDGATRFAIFRYVELPRLRLVLLIAILLRFMDSFMIYTEAYVVTRGGPGVSTTFLSHELVQTALIQFDLGEGGAISVIYFFIVLAVSYAFFRVIAPERQR
jgi:glycerol transport system permease protein